MLIQTATIVRTSLIGSEHTIKVGPLLLDTVSKQPAVQDAGFRLSLTLEPGLAVFIALTTLVGTLCAYGLFYRHKIKETKRT